MNIRSFLKLVEIQTKVASMIPFSIGSIYAAYRYHEFHINNFIFMFFSLLAFDMATTAINNYMDYKKAKRTHGYGYETHNAIVRDNLHEASVVAVIIILLSTAVTFGILLFLNTSIVVLLLGALSFAVGVLYSFGPLPISRMPLGEAFSGFFMGFMIILLSIYIHVYDGSLINIAYTGNILSINISLLEIIYIFLLSVPAVSGIANIMLANNICDMEEDIENKRFTLPIYIGREKALMVFRTLYYIAFAAQIILIVIGVEPLLCALLLAVFYPVNKNINTFTKLQTKKDTFVLSVKNFVLMNISLIITLLISLLIG